MKRLLVILMALPIAACAPEKESPAASSEEPATHPVETAAIDLEGLPEKQPPIEAPSLEAIPGEDAFDDISFHSMPAPRTTSPLALTRVVEIVDRDSRKAQSIRIDLNSRLLKKSSKPRPAILDLTPYQDPYAQPPWKNGEPLEMSDDELIRELLRINDVRNKGLYAP